VKLFVDSTDPAEIAACVVAKQTTGVSITGRRLQQAAPGTPEGMRALLRAICGAANGPVTVEVGADGADRDEILREARRWAEVAPNVVAMLPATEAGMDVLRACAGERIRAGVGVCASAEQALAAARAGAAYVAAPVGRVGGFDGNDEIRKLAALFRTFGVATEIVAGAIRIPTDVIDAALAGAHAAVAPAAVVRELDAESSRQADGRG
jgi:transaldolase